MLPGSLTDTNIDDNTNTFPAWKEETPESASASSHSCDGVPKPGLGVQPVQLGPGRHLDCTVQVGEKKMNILIDKTFLDSTQEKAFLW